MKIPNTWHSSFDTNHKKCYFWRLGLRFRNSKPLILGMEANSCEYNETKMEAKDRIYGFVCIPDDFMGIVKSRSFMRLEHIHQLGTMFVFESSVESYMRAEHCIGTFWQAKRMLEALEKNTEWLKDLQVNPNRVEEYAQYTLYRKAVQIAALLHDVGHGPFSHAWEEIEPNFHHEENAFLCVDDIFANLDHRVLPEFRENHGYGIKLIKALILGMPNNVQIPDKYKFIFEIVNNKQCKLDVDKWDYIERDYSYLKNITDIADFNHDIHVDFSDLFLEARVSSNGQHIEYRYKDYHLIYALFRMRTELHVKFYGRVSVLLRDSLMMRMVRRCEQRINELKITDITSSNIEHFLQLTDDRVLELLRDDTEFKYLSDSAKVKIIDPKDVDKDSNQVVEYVERVFAGAGVEMPADTAFHFYGDPSEKISVERDLDNLRNRSVFLLGD